MRFLGRVSEGLTNFVHCGADAVLKLHYRVVRPQPFANLLARHYIAGTLQQQSKNSQRLFRQTKSLTPNLAQLTRAKIELESFEPDKRIAPFEFQHDESQKLPDSTISLELSDASRVSANTVKPLQTNKFL